MTNEIKRMTRDRGAIFLETAFVLPIFLILLCLTVDLPRIMSARQRLIGAGRIISEIRARNNNNQVLNGKSLKSYFFNSSSANSIKLNIQSGGIKDSLLSGLADDIKNKWGKFGKIINFLATLFSGGNFDPYFVNVFSKDRFYNGKVSANMPTLLPQEAYTAFSQHNAPTAEIQSPFDCYMPNTDSCKFTGKTFIDKMLQWLHDHFGI